MVRKNKYTVDVGRVNHSGYPAAYATTLKLKTLTKSINEWHLRQHSNTTNVQHNHIPPREQSYFNWQINLLWSGNKMEYHMSRMNSRIRTYNHILYQQL
jgi:hypothetical protein